MTLFSALTRAPRDPILGLTEAFNADPRPSKVNLGVGVYTDDEGRLPLLRAVRAAEQRLFEAAAPHGYQPIDGDAAYNAAVQKLLFGADSSLIAQRRIVTVQALGGTGALKIGADFLKFLNPEAKVAISHPSWENHRALFESAGFEVSEYPYYDAATRGVQFDGLSDALQRMTPGTVVVFHACCHNPTGVDLSDAQWARIIQIVRQRESIPFIDIAYQGFGAGVEADAHAVRRFAAADIACFVASSLSKSMSLYGERVGALSIVTSNADEAARVLSRLKRIIRTNFSNPPIYGAALVATVLTHAHLRTQWIEELEGMRARLNQMRNALADKLTQLGAASRFDFIRRQRGMFSYSGLTAPQVERLKTEFGIYAVSTGRICLAALNTKNIDTVAQAIIRVLD